MAIRIGLIGKTNTGKTTFFNAAALMSERISTYPFTTEAARHGTAHAVTLCVHPEFKVQDNPNNSRCIEGRRHVPIEIIDLPGLIRGAWRGKGLGNQFLSVAAQSDALLHVLDASGGIDSSGNIASAGTGDPISDYADIEEELIMWYHKILEGNRDRVSRLIGEGASTASAIANLYSGIGASESHARIALAEAGLESERFEDFGAQDTKRVASVLRRISKPTLVVANKVDVPGAEKNFERLREHCSSLMVVPTSADSELSLMRAEQKGFIRYLSGSEQFEIVNRAGLSESQRKALEFIKAGVMGDYMRTGVQFAIDTAVFKLLKMNAVYPVTDPKTLADRKGRVLPDLFLLKDGATVADLAREVHTDLVKGLLYADDVRYGLRLPTDYRLRDRDVVSLVSASKKPGSVRPAPRQAAGGS